MGLGACARCSSAANASRGNMKHATTFVAALGLVLLSACGDDDSEPATGARDASVRGDAGPGASGRGGNGGAGRGGATATPAAGARSDAGADPSTSQDAGSTPVADGGMPGAGDDLATPDTTPDATVSDAG